MGSSLFLSDETWSWGSRKLQLLQPRTQGVATSGYPPGVPSSFPWGRGAYNQEAWSLVERCRRRARTIGLAEDQTRGWPMSTPALTHRAKPQPPSQSLVGPWGWGGCGDTQTSDSQLPRYPGEPCQLDGGRACLSAFDSELAKCHKLSSDKCLLRVQRLLPAATFQVWLSNNVDSSLHCFASSCINLAFFSSSRRPCPISPLQLLLAQHNVLWKSSQRVASAAKIPKSQPWSD